MIEKTYAGERTKIEMEKTELEELMACEREKAYWKGNEEGKEEGNERIKKAVRAFAILLNLLLDEKK